MRRACRAALAVLVHVALRLRSGQARGGLRNLGRVSGALPANVSTSAVAWARGWLTQCPSSARAAATRLELHRVDAGDGCGASSGSSVAVANFWRHLQPARCNQFCWEACWDGLEAVGWAGLGAGRVGRRPKWPGRCNRHGRCWAGPRRARRHGSAPAASCAKLYFNEAPGTWTKYFNEVPGTWTKYRVERPNAG